MKPQFVLPALLFACAAVARPVEPGAGMITLPLKRVPRARTGVHPHIEHQQHVNLAKRRLASMTGREPPSDQELRSQLEKRMSSIVDSQLSKRFNRYGVPIPKHGRKPAIGATPNSFASTSGSDNDNGNVTNDAQQNNSSASALPPVKVEALTDGGVTDAKQPTSRNSLGLNIIASDVGYFSTVQIGTPPRDFRILMDSGSADLWVGSENCVSVDGGGCGNHTFLGGDSSSTFQSTGRPFSITYGTGAVSGVVVTDNVRFGNFQLTGHTFGVGLNESQEFSRDSTAFDGLMGLAQSRLSKQQTLTPIEDMARKGIIREPIISYKISRLVDQQNDGQITFGGLDRSRFDANTLVTLPNQKNDGFWVAALDKVTVNGQELGLQQRTAILDTGTTLLLLPPSDAALVHKGIPDAEQVTSGFTIPCNTTAQVGLTFGGREFIIDHRDLVFAPVDLDNPDPNGRCISGISSGNVDGNDQWLVGATFLKSVYFSTNAKGNSMTLANLV